MKLFFVIISIVIFSLRTFSQSNEHLLYVSTDLVKLTTNAWQESFKNNMEFDTRFLYKGIAGLYLAGGMVDRHPEYTKLHRNLYDYRSWGKYFNCGLNFQSKNDGPNVTVSLGLIKSYYSETANYLIKGNYWDDKFIQPISFMNNRKTAVYTEVGLRLSTFKKSKLGIYMALGCSIGDYDEKYRHPPETPKEQSQIDDYIPNYIPGIIDRNFLGPLKFKVNLYYQIL